MTEGVYSFVQELKEAYRTDEGCTRTSVAVR